MNTRIFDLMKVFKRDFLHPDFKGSASIKNVLPVLLPKLSYKDLNIQNGTMAMTEWERMVVDELEGEEREELRTALLKYCELDTFAMVEIYRYLIEYLKS